MHGGSHRWYTRADCAAIARCHVATIDRARKRGELQWTKDGTNGRRILIREDWLEAWLLIACVGLVACIPTCALGLSCVFPDSMVDAFRS